MALDTISKVNETRSDSNPGVIGTSIGGVGFNVSLACKYAGGNSKLISIIGDDYTGEFIKTHLNNRNIDISGLQILPGGRTSQYNSMHDSNGELIMACADMSIIENDFSDFIISQINPQIKLVVFDCNLSSETMNKVINNLDKKVIIEPTSLKKAATISQLNLPVYPNNKITLITPTQAELESIYTAIPEEKYDTEWFGIIDRLNIDHELRNQFPRLSLNSGIMQQAIKLLPFFQNILIKNGKSGIVLVSLINNIEDVKSIPTTSNYAPTKRLFSGSQGLGILIEQFPIPAANHNLTIKNVTGAGDSLVGYLISKLHHSILNDIIELPEQQWLKWEVIHNAQLSSGLSLMDSDSISAQIQGLKLSGHL